MVTRSVWVTIIIVITWVASTIAIVTESVPVFNAVLLTFAATFYLTIFGILKQKDI